jgi:hypothetical protein
MPRVINLFSDVYRKQMCEWCPWSGRLSEEPTTEGDLDEEATVVE